ncbi:MAG: methylated-DNA--[Clostridia bacterium]|nr:methylated-DNA--[protein]-cysteine S-methyltransferase [Clostridia bacterium]
MEWTSHLESPLGGITLASDGEALTGLWFDGQAHFARTLSPLHADGRLPVFDETRHWLDLYFGGRDPGFTPPLRPRGSAFRRAVWEVLLTVPRGQTVTYGEIAARMGLPRTSARAVGGAVARNPISVIIPCHRVIGAGGRLTGYAGGVSRKSRLLALEGADSFLRAEKKPSGEHSA